MTAAGWAQLIALIVVIGVTAPLLGRYMANVYEAGPSRLDRVFGPVERLVYRACRIDPEREQRWNVYALSVLAFSVVGIVLLYLIQRIQSGLPFNPTDMANVAPALSLNTAVSFPVVLHETKHALQTYLRVAGLNLTLQELHDAIASPDVKELVGLSLHGHIAPHDYQRALGSERPRLQQIYRDYFAAHRVEAVLFATTPLPAAPIAGSDSTVALNGARVPTFATYIRNTDPASNAGIPAISFPAITGSGHLPLGVEIDGPYGSDRRLLAIAAALQAILERHSTNPQRLLP